MSKTIKALFFCIFTLFITNIHSQIKIKHLASDNNEIDSLFFGFSETRIVRILNKEWAAFSEKNDNKKTKTSIPCVFSGSDELIFETNFSLTQDEIENKTIKLCFLGIYNYSEISINNFNIYKKSGSEIPFEIELPKDVLDINNSIKIKVRADLDKENSIPINQRFLFPKNPTGIVRDVYLKILPKIYISDVDLPISFDNNLNFVSINASFAIKNLITINEILGEEELGSQVKINVRIKPANFNGNTFNYEFLIDNTNAPLINRKQIIQLQNPSLWSPNIPNYYNIEISLLVGSQLIDRIYKEISFSQFREDNENIILNNQSFRFQGTTYYLNEGDLTETTSYKRLYDDLLLIKKTGFNVVRFAKSYPHPYALKICKQIGLIPLVELPLNSIPEALLEDYDFRTRASARFNDMISQYSRFSNNIIYGLGSSYLNSSIINYEFIEFLLNNLENKNIITYASFFGLPKYDVTKLTFIGIEIYSQDTDKFFNQFDNPSLEQIKHKFFISEVNYPDYFGSSTGYLTKNSTEAQAKYFVDVIDESIEKKISGFFINSFYNYSGDYSSLYGGYSDEKFYNLGIIKNESGVNSLPYRAINAKLNQLNSITIPIGGSQDENKLIFILLALVLSILMAVLINIKKKFREDCSRALFKPYNFFADVRDHRIISGVHTIILMIVEIGSMALFVTIILYYLRSNLLFDKLLLSFGYQALIDFISYISWNPEKSLFYLSILMLLKIAILTFIIKIGSLFIKTRIGILSIFYTVVWSFLPFTLLLPVELILYKVLSTTDINIYIVVFIMFFCLWIFQRVVKGIHVIFEIRGIIIYSYALLFFILLAVGITLYFQATNNTIYHIINSVKQYSSLSF